MAKAAASLENLSGGRFVMGVASGDRRPAGGVSRLRTGARLARRSLPRIAGLLQHLLAEDYPSILMKKVGYDGLHFSAWDGARAGKAYVRSSEPRSATASR